jgi:ABC-type glycerol-3-phosphate transport system permease component
VNSLAFVVSIMFLLVLVSGPLCYLLSLFKWMPNWFIWTIAICNIFIGLWWLMLPISIIRYLGLINIVLGILSIQKRNNKNANISNYNSKLI